MTSTRMTVAGTVRMIARLSSLRARLIPTSTPSGTLVDYARVGHGVRITYLRNVPDGTRFKGSIQITEVWQPIVAEGAGAWNGWSRSVTISGQVDNPQCVPVFVRRIEEPAHESLVDTPKLNDWKRYSPQTGVATTGAEYADMQSDGADRFTGTLHYTAKSNAPHRPAIVPDYGDSIRGEFTTVPGFSATRLPLPRSIMPTAMTWTKQGTLAFTSLKGQVYLARDTNGDGLEDKLDLFEEGLAAPYGIISDPQDDSLIVSHKPELLRLIDTDGDGRVDLRKVLATGWGYNDNYHDWTCGIVRDSKGNLYVGLGSDYTQPKRPVEQQKWRGKILRIDPSGYSKPIASGLRYPTGLAMTPDDDLFVSDNQGEQNVFNELNHIVEGSKYGVPSREDPTDERPAATPAIQIPHPWTRSVNGVFFLPRDARLGDQGTPHPFAGHGIGCEYDSRFLVRFTLQKVGDTFQGAIYSFSQNQVPADQPNFEPILCGGVSPRGDIYVGCMHDSGWSGGLNVGSLIRISSNGPIPLGIRELWATKSGFQIDFTGPVDRQAAALAANYSISAYTRKWQGTYATADSNRHEVAITGVTVSDDGLQVQLQTDKSRAGYVYEVTCGKIGTASETPPWPATGHYTMNRIPE